MDEKVVLAIINEVNAEFSESMARIAAADEPLGAPDKEQAQDEFLELVIYGNKVPTVADFLHKFYGSGSGVIKVCPDMLVTDGTVSKVFRYNLAESLKEALLACRAGYFVYGDGQWLNGHGDSFVMANAPHEGRTAALSPGVPLDAVVGRQNGDTE